MGNGDRSTCQRNCWWMALLGGLVLWLILALALGHPAFKALLISAILAVVAGFVLRWALCGAAQTTDADPSTSEPYRPATPAPAPAPTPHEEVPAPRTVAEPAEPAPVAQSAPIMVAPTPRPDPSQLADLPAAVAAAPAKPARKPRAAADKAAVKAEPRKPAAKPKPAASKAPAAAKKATVTETPATGLDAAMGRTKEKTDTETTLLLKPRGGKADDLKLIVGVGPKLEKLLNDIGVWHFDQIASWKARDIALVDSKMENFKGRITRDGWVKQARALAKGAKPGAEA